MKKTWNEDWIDEEDLVDETSYIKQQRLLRGIQDIDADLLEEDMLEEGSLNEFWFTRGEQDTYNNFDEGD